jgi:S-adenosylmethionine:tRNA ribosyltransferase-isomerase
VDLVVGLGTFRPIATAHVDDHHMHAERYRVPEATMAACAAADRVVAVGTTTVRALESAAATGELSGRTDLFIHGDRPFALVRALLTNFHQPRSSLLVLVDAFVGPRWRSLYAEALTSGYRFLSFGDAMFLRGERG